MKLDTLRHFWGDRGLYQRVRGRSARGCSLRGPGRGRPAAVTCLNDVVIKSLGERGRGKR